MICWHNVVQHLQFASFAATRLQQYCNLQLTHILYKQLLWYLQLPSTSSSHAALSRFPGPLFPNTSKDKVNRPNAQESTAQLRPSINQLASAFLQSRICSLITNSLTLHCLSVFAAAHTLICMACASTDIHNKPCLLQASSQAVVLLKL